MRFGSLPTGKRLVMPYGRTAAFAFAVVGDNSELAIGGAVATFDVTSSQAWSRVAGLLSEVPVPGQVPRAGGLRRVRASR